MIDIEDNIVTKTSTYSISEKDESKLIENKEAISMLHIDSPDVIENIGLNQRLLERDSKLDEITDESIPKNIDSNRSNRLL